MIAYCLCVASAGYPYARLTTIVYINGRAAADAGVCPPEN